MSFFPTQGTRLVPGHGKDSAKVLIVGDYTTPFDDKSLVPFSGPNGTVLESCLQVAGIIKSEVYMTNLFKSKTTRPGKMAYTDYYDDKKKKFTDLGLKHVDMLIKEIDNHDANLIITCGNSALHALTGLTSCAKFRGYVTASRGLNRVRKIIPTYSTLSVMHGQFANRHMIVADFKKAKLECEFPEIIRPERELVYNYRTVEEALEWLDYYEHQDIVGFDTEVINFEMSCISFASTPQVACVIPIGTTEFHPQGWTEDEELQLWRGIQRVLGNPRSKKIVQNGSFDLHFLLTRCGIEVRGEIHDTMIGHSVMFPELPKGLGFLGSIYCGSQEYWKDSVQFKNIKEES